MKKFLITITSILLFSNCANIVPPSGGPRDLEAPIYAAAYSTPNEETNTNYTKDYIELTFNEKVAVKNPSGEIITTPLLDIKKFKVTADKNKVKLEFKQELDTNTTYIINFGKCITDITEGTVAENIQVAFSTGPLMDSLVIRGTVKSHTTNTPLANTYVYLYDVNDTIKPLDGKPKYFTKTNSLGAFNFKHLKVGEYELITLNEKFQNFKYERGKEQIGFLAESILLNQNKIDVSIFSIVEPDTLFKINSISPRENYYQVKLSKGFDIDNSNYPETVQHTYNEAKNIIQLFSQQIDSSIINLKLTDSLGTTIDSTFKVLPKNEPTEKKLIKSINTKRINDTLFTAIQLLEPLLTLDTSLIEISRVKDSTVTTKEGLRINKVNNNTEILLYNTNNRLDTLRISIADSSLQSITGTYNKSVETIYKPQNNEDYGIIKGSISTSYNKYLIQLIDNKGVITHTTSSKNEYTFKNVVPGGYSIRVLIDENNDGMFESGSYINRTLPELIYFFNKPLRIKANWEFLDTNISF